MRAFFLSALTLSPRRAQAWSLPHEGLGFGICKNQPRRWDLEGGKQGEGLCEAGSGFVGSGGPREPNTP